MLDLSVVVVSYNTLALLRECLASATRSLAMPLPDGRQLKGEVFVVDNASQDGSAEMVRAEFPQARLIANDANRGFAAANNQALAQARGRYYLLLNPDTLALDDALPRLVEFMDGCPSAGAAGGQLLNSDGSRQHSAFRFPNLWMSFFDFFPINHRLANSRLNGRYPRSCYQRPFQIDHPLGACLIVRREAAEQIGPLDEQFFMYCEEIDWCMRLKLAGWQVWYTPEARIVHHVAQSSRQFRGPMLVALHRSRYRLFAKHYSPGFQRWNRRIVRTGLRWQALRDWWAVARGRLSREEFGDRLMAYGQIWGLQ
ncbi:MAG: glycosyltransferase family 2 protein [Bacteroidetes bacterium]|nr:glycosyltransferase family 2 protein [Bacteroidota bacterium]MCL5025125.1 glycosyltransferase family 2 protein [Chloroflexota bacterium]